MRRFSIFEYVKRNRWFVILFFVICTISCWFVLSKKQTYSASVVISYENSGAATGYTPAGTLIDTSEIYSASNAAAVIKKLGIRATVDSIRNGCSVEQVIPEDVQTKINAAASKGEDYSYTPTEYKITFTVGCDYSESYAYKVLSALISNYFEEYGEKYVTQETVPSDAADSASDSYDYLENAEIIKNSVDNMLYYLKNVSGSWPDFRASSSGYTFGDLYSEYNTISERDINALYASILGNKATKNLDLLNKKYSDRITQNNLSIANGNSTLSGISELLKTYAEKAKEESSYTAGTNQDSTNGSILNQLYDDNNTSTDHTTTYDKEMQQYVTLSESVSNLKTDNDYCSMVFDTYKDAKDITDAEAVELNSTEKEMLSSLSELYQNVKKTASEFNAYQGQKNISVMSGTVLSPSINMELYMGLAIILFVIVGCFGAAVIGRIGDLIEYTEYYDKVTGLLNRTGIDRLIENADRDKTRKWSVIAVIVTNLGDVNRKKGRAVGDGMLRDFAKAAESSSRGAGKACYNGAGRFLIFYPDMSMKRAKAFARYLSEEVNAFGSDNVPEFTYGIAETNEAGAASLRELLITALSRSKETIGGEEKEDER